MKFSASDVPVGIVSWDYGENARGGLGRAMAEISTCLCGTNHIVHRFSQMIQCIANSRFLFIVWLFGGLQQWIDTRRIRIMILPTGPGGLFLFRKPRSCRLIVVSYHTYWQQSQMVPGEWWKRVFVPLERRTLALADQVLCYSLDTERVLLRQYGVHGTKLKLLPQLLDLDAWCPSLIAKEVGLCVCVARLDQRKGIDVLLQAWPSVVRVWPTAHLVIVGDGRGRTRVQDFSAHHSSVRWVPSLPREELVRLVQRADIAVCPSYLEGFGLACAEAMAAGTAVVASDCDGLQSLIRHRETGWLVPPGDPEAIAEGILVLLRDTALRRQLAERARGEIVRVFDGGKAARHLITILEDPASSREVGS